MIKMPPKDIEKSARYEWQFARSLNEARNRIDLTSPPGKMLDKIITPLFKKYGFYDNQRLLTDMDMYNVSDKEISFFKDNTTEEMLRKLSIDLSEYSNLSHNNVLPIEEKSQLTNAYTRAINSLQSVKKKLVSEKYTSGNTAWDIFGVLSHVTKFYNLLTAALQTTREHQQTENRHIAEHLQKLLYHRPKKIEQNIKETAKKFNIAEYQVTESFKKIIGESPKDYVEILLKEGLGDYMHHKAGEIKNKAVSKFGVGQAKTIAQAKLDNTKAMDTMLSKWSKTVLGKKEAATPQALEAFLTNQFKVDPTVIQNTLKKYKKNLIKENTSKTILEASYLPQAELRNFFLDIVNAQRALSATPTKKPVVKKQPVAPQIQPVTAAPVAPSVPAPQVPTSPNTQASQQSAPQNQPTNTAPTGQTSIGDVTKTLNALPANLRAKAILQALPSLSDEQIKQVLTGLVSKKP